MTGYGQKIDRNQPGRILVVPVAVTRATAKSCRSTKACVFVFVFCFLSIIQVSSAQTLFNLTTERQIQFRLDLLRKGIQQEDTCKILMALAPEPCNDSRTAEAAASVVRQMQAMFEKGPKRKMLLPRPSLPRADSRLLNSNFWDFDILNPVMTFRSDSAIVDCELVLWGGKTSDPDKGRGLRAEERFVFVSSVVEKEPVSDPDEFRPFEREATAATSAAANMNWQLAGVDGLLSLLQTGTSDSLSTTEKAGEK